MLSLGVVPQQNNAKIMKRPSFIAKKGKKNILLKKSLIRLTLIDFVLRV
jgi:hypothetical protein